MSAVALAWYRNVSARIAAQQGVSAQLQAHALLELCLRASDVGEVVARRQMVAKWLHVSIATAKRVIKALIQAELLGEDGRGALVLCMSDDVRIKYHGDTTGYHGDTLKAHGDTLRCHGDTLGPQGGYTKCHGDTSSKVPDNIPISPLIIDKGREETRIHARTRKASPSPPDDSNLEPAKVQEVLEAYRLVFHHGLVTLLQPGTQRMVIQACRDHTTKTVLEAIRLFESKIIEAREAGRPWRRDRDKMVFAFRELQNEINDLKSGRAVAAARKHSRRRNGQHVGINDAWEKDQAKPEKSFDWGELKSCL